MDESIGQLSLFGPPKLSELTPPRWLDSRLGRLERLLELHQAHDKHLNLGGQRLLQRSIFATYLDCRDLGGDVQAEALIVRYRRKDADMPKASS